MLGPEMWSEWSRSHSEFIAERGQEPGTFVPQVDAEVHTTNSS